MVGTWPEHQGRGIGYALLAPVLEHCDRERLPAYLEATSERNEPLYMRHGFAVTDEIRIPGGPTLWGMCGASPAHRPERWARRVTGLIALVGSPARSPRLGATA